jgi:hypothetical protein
VAIAEAAVSIEAGITAMAVGTTAMAEAETSTDAGITAATVEAATSTTIVQTAHAMRAV